MGRRQLEQDLKTNRHLLRGLRDRQAELRREARDAPRRLVQLRLELKHLEARVPKINPELMRTEAELKHTRANVKRLERQLDVDSQTSRLRMELDRLVREQRRCTR